MSESIVNGTDRPRAGRGKIRSAVKQLMDLMVDGLSVPASDEGKTHDLIVVGGGSAGFAAAMETALAGVSTLVIDRSDYEEASGSVAAAATRIWRAGWRAGNPVILPHLQASATTSICYPARK